MINMDQYKREDVTHLLECKFYNSQRSHVYFMPCIKLSETKRGKVKVVLFGWRDRDESSLPESWRNRKRIVYVSKWKLTEINKQEKNYGTKLGKCKGVDG